MRTACVPPARRRPGFTLIELLVVITIILALSGLVLGAVFNLREAQMKSFSETTVQKLASALDQQWKAVLDQVRDETTPDWAMKLANNDTRRARVIFTKARLKQEFPVTFFQAKYPYLGGTPGGPVQSFNTAQVPLGLTDRVLGPKPTYSAALATFLPTNNQVPQIGPYESAALLFLTLSQGRRGMAVNIEEFIEPTAIQTRIADLPNNQKAEVRVFVDAWGNPLRYYPFPFDNDELNADPYVTTTATLTTARDPQDPEGTLYSPPSAWLTTSRNLFPALVHPLNTNVVTPPQLPVARHLIPVVASAGRDGFWGIDPVTMGPAAPVADAGDNIYSYRLRKFGARGD